MLDEIKPNSLGAPSGSASMSPAPLSCMDDFEEFRSGFNNFKTGKWRADRWTTLRLRFGIYAQKQDGMHMVRSKLPGGRLSFDRARAIAHVNREFCGSDVHITTRQGIQFYFVTLDGTVDMLRALFSAGMTTREASGNTFRNVTACPLAGFCPREHVDAGAVAERLATTWIRHPLVQHMPRKFKAAVSGCDLDCGATSIDDLGFIAYTNDDGEHGFRVVAGGGLGIQTRTAVQLLEFVSEEEMPAVQEALARLHHRFSNRKKKMASRLKFLVARFGEEKFRNLFIEEFERARRLPPRPWEPLEWRTPEDDQSPPHLPGGRMEQHDGSFALVVRPPLGMLSSDRLERLTDLSEKVGASEFRITREQNIIVMGVPSSRLDELTGEIRGLGLEVDQRPGGTSDVVSCPGTSTCPIGITNSDAFARSILADANTYAGLPETRVRISGCHNSCGQHHIGDFGFHGVAKKINGVNMPHYQVHIGGELKAPYKVAIEGPVIPAIYAKKALELLLNDYDATREQDESVSHWAEAKGEQGIRDLLSNDALGYVDAEDPRLRLDIGDDKQFFPPVSAIGECAASAVVGEFLADLAKVGRLDMDRYLEVGDVDAARNAGRKGFISAARRLLLVIGVETDIDDEEKVISEIISNYGSNQKLMSAMDDVINAKLSEDRDLEAFKKAMDSWIDTTDITVEETLSPLAMIGVPA